MPFLVAIADDMTGALEIGAKFAKYSFQAAVTTRCSLDNVDAGVLVIDTESRHMQAAEAARCVGAVANECRRLGVSRIYKKTDSTLRGNPGAELQALITCGPHNEIFFAPAYPALGRTAIAGRLHVDGVPVHLTAFANDPLHPVAESSIAKILRPHVSAKLIAVGAQQEPSRSSHAVYLFDGETDADVERVARLIVAEPGWTAAGPAGLADAIAGMLGNACTRRLHVAGRTLVVNGSLHELARRQVQAAVAAGWPQLDLDSEPNLSEWVILKQEERVTDDCLSYARKRASKIARLLQQNRIDTLVVFGGDTAYAILQSLECSRVESIGELLPGVALSRLVSDTKSRLLVSKAGGFGEPDTLLRIRKLLSA